MTRLFGQTIIPRIEIEFAASPQQYVSAMVP